jgi:hypothetical protein
VLYLEAFYAAFGVDGLQLWENDCVSWQYQESGTRLCTNGAEFVIRTRSDVYCSSGFRRLQDSKRQVSSKGLNLRLR